MRNFFSDDLLSVLVWESFNESVDSDNLQPFAEILFDLISYLPTHSGHSN